MKLLRTEPRALSARLHAQVDTLLRTAFDLEGSYDYGPDRADMVLVLGDDDRAVGHAATYRRAISIGDETLTVGMIGGVAIDAAHRRHGHVRRLMAEVHRHFTAEALPFSLLFAFVPAVYRSSGYRDMTNTTRFLDHDGAWKDLVFRGGMVAELGGRRWPNLPIDLRGPSV
ncbi:MAG TPA: GNAT family N-acetyltransferase [Alphaproteobacteria bacterium]|jgi:predicted N-acetyltransferase YhbS|nr:GNAT family N-acetyltransferase [Alphaproteobacteria bacterium]